MFPAGIENFTFLPSNTQKARKDNTLRWLCCYKAIDGMKVPFLQGEVIFKNHTHDRIWLKYHLCSRAT
jgi:hypothetical protein